MRQLLITIAVVVLVGCGESQQTSPQPETGSQTAPINSIHDAAKRGDIEAVKQYLADNANVNSKDSKGMTPFAKDNTIVRTPLHIAAGAGHKKIVELLIAKGADVNAMAEDGSSPLDVALGRAIRRKHTEIVDLLRKHGAKTAEELKAEGK